MSSEQIYIYIYTHKTIAIKVWYSMMQLKLLQSKCLYHYFYWSMHTWS